MKPSTMILLALPALLAAPARAQLGNDPFDAAHTLEVHADTAPTNSSANWKRRVRAKTRVGRFCFQNDGFVWDPTSTNVPSETDLTSLAYAESGQNDLTTATATAFARWGSVGTNDFYMTTRAQGESLPVSDRCIGAKNRAARAKAKAKSKLKLMLDGAHSGTSGAMGFVGAWVNKQDHLRKSKRRAKVLSDPVFVRMFDGGGALLGEWETIRIDSTIRSNGETSMGFDHIGLYVLTNSAQDMELFIEVGSPIVLPGDRGVLHVIVEDNVVTRRELTGRFAAVTGIPPVGATSGAWSAQISLQNIRYDVLPHVGAHSGPTRVELEMSGGSQSEPEGGLVGQTCSLRSEVGRGFDDADLSVVPPSDSEIGLSCLTGSTGLLDHVTTTFDAELDYLVIPYILPGAPPDTAPEAVYVRLYDGNPALGGTLFYGDSITPQSFDPLDDVEFTETYRVTSTDKNSQLHAINEVFVDLSSAPPAPEGTSIWIHVDMIPPAAYADVLIPPSPFADSAQDQAYEYSVASGAFTPRFDAGSQRSLCLAFELYATPVVATTYCTAGTSSNGCVPSISASGAPSLAASSGFTISVENVEGQKSGLIFYGIHGPSATPWAAGSSSILCVKAPTQRMGAQNSGGVSGACTGALSTDWLAYLAGHPAALGQPFSPGFVVNAQAWYRDPPAVKTTNLSNGLQFVTVP